MVLLSSCIGDIEVYRGEGNANNLEIDVIWPGIEGSLDQMMKQKLNLLGFDAEDALDRFSGNSCLLEKYIGLMVVDFNQRLPATKTAIERHDFKDAAQQLHSLQGSAFALAALELAGACRFCEEMCLMNDERNAINSLKSIELKVSQISQIVVNPLP